jgi:hypothetical protein
MEILEKTIKQMPDVFTSNYFNNQAIKNGYPEELLKRKGLSKFLHIYAYNSNEFSKTWTKKKQKVSLDNKSIALSDEEMINHLKSKGYKIMRPVNEWIEI